MSQNDCRACEILSGCRMCAWLAVPVCIAKALAAASGKFDGNNAKHHANLSIMLPERPTALNADFAAEFSSRQSLDEDGKVKNEAHATHHQQICPNCDQMLTGHHCKLVCTRCGYYLSCADYY